MYFEVSHSGEGLITEMAAIGKGLVDTVGERQEIGSEGIRHWRPGVTSCWRALAALQGRWWWWWGIRSGGIRRVIQHPRDGNTCPIWNMKVMIWGRAILSSHIVMLRWWFAFVWNQNKRFLNSLGLILMFWFDAWSARFHSLHGSL